MIRMLALVLALGAGQALAAGPRVASINTCTDQLVLALADDDQILGLSPFARDATLSWHARRAQRFPLLSGQAEDVLPLRPDLVFTATFVKPDTRALLRRTGHRIEEFPAAASIAEVKGQIRRAGALLDQQERAEAAIARVDAAVMQARAAASRTPLRVLPLERRGWVSGLNSLTTDMLAVTGLANLGGTATGAIGGRLSMEAIVALKPDRLLLSAPVNQAEDQGSAFLHHPALARVAPAGTHLVVPEAMTVCGGPMLADALMRLSEEISRTAPPPR